MLTIGQHPARIDLAVRAGEPIDFTVDVLDAAGLPQGLFLWTGAAQIWATTQTGAAALYSFVVVLNAVGSVRVTAAGADTATWTFFAAPWDLVLTAPSGAKTVHAAGWVRCYPTLSR